MNKELAKSLLALVNQENAYFALQDLVAYEIADTQKKLENASLEEVKGLQAKMKLLRRFEKLREEVLARVKDAEVVQ